MVTWSSTAPERDGAAASRCRAVSSTTSPGAGHLPDRAQVRRRRSGAPGSDDGGPRPRARRGWLHRPAGGHPPACRRASGSGGKDDCGGVKIVNSYARWSRPTTAGTGTATLSRATTAAPLDIAQLGAEADRAGRLRRHRAVLLPGRPGQHLGLHRRAAGRRRRRLLLPPRHARHGRGLHIVQGSWVYRPDRRTVLGASPGTADIAALKGGQPVPVTATSAATLTAATDATDGARPEPALISGVMVFGNPGRGGVPASVEGEGMPANASRPHHRPEPAGPAGPSGLAGVQALKAAGYDVSVICPKGLATRPAR